jgi:hypothetical protein
VRPEGATQRGRRICAKAPMTHRPARLVGKAVAREGEWVGTASWADWAGINGEFKNQI